jgi:hypothetical protein
MSQACQVRLRSVFIESGFDEPTRTPRHGPREKDSRLSSVPHPVHVAPSTTVGNPPIDVTRSSCRSSWTGPGTQVWSEDPRSVQASRSPLRPSCSTVRRATTPSIAVATSPSSVAVPRRSPARIAGIGSRPVSRPTGSSRTGIRARVRHCRAMDCLRARSAAFALTVSAALAALSAALKSNAQRPPKGS